MSNIKMWRVCLSLSLVVLVVGQSLHFEPHGGSSSNSILCPDRRGTCPEDSTCCLLRSGSYGCCPLVQAVCCKDYEHCCPSGSICDIEHSTCTMGNLSIPMVTKHTADPVTLDDICSCPDESICCRMQGGSWGCCPVPEGVCCKDGVHCCPAKYTCNSKDGSCDKVGNSNPWFMLRTSTPSKPGYIPKPSVSKLAKSVTTVDMSLPAAPTEKRCPGGQTFCNGKNTCCFRDKWHFSCCPYNNGICCPGGEQCCPLGFSCDVKLGKCTKGEGISLPWGKTYDSKTTFEPEPEEPTEKEALELPRVTCPGSAVSCPYGSTCCILVSGDYGCCPMADAVCCPDHMHCCPLGTVCDVQAATCNQASYSVPWSSKTPALPHLPGVSSGVVCPDASSECPDGSTCCLLLSGQYGCCEMKEAVCCSDHLHCCPQNTICDLVAGKCIHRSYSAPWSSKTPALPHVEDDSSPVDSSVTDTNNIKCHDGSECPADNTCCMMSDQEYGCCPMKKAVCCDDKDSCCPHGTTCDTAHQRCLRGDFSVPWSAKIPAIRKSSNMCADGKTTCSSGATCCRDLAGGFSCCPFDNAKCCPDKIHCCPSNQVCDSARGACVNPRGVVMNWLEKLQTQRQSDDIVCPDEQTCPEHNTCCQISVGLFGCCPLEKAVCCSDHEHCCPEGYTCDIESGQCNTEGHSMPLQRKTAAQESPNRNTVPTNKICPDKVSSCPDQTTCCLLSAGQYGCCPLPEAVCCTDGVHCCPNGYTCDVKGGTCMMETVSIPWVAKFAAKPVTSEAGWVVCPDKRSQCQSGQTCCKLASGDYGCCPIPNAVCCSDGSHCCPEGSTCNVAAGTCMSNTNSLVISWSTVHRLTTAFNTDNELTVTDIKCPDSGTCPAGTTCCQMKDGYYGCCPYTQAVCCADQLHCCPQGFHCDKTGLRCDTLDSSISLTSSLFTRFHALPAESSVNIVKCPGGKEQCPDGTTCCKQSDGKYGCCQFDNAVCCSDGVHCCPQGYACDPQSGSCTQSVQWHTRIAGTPVPLVGGTPVPSVEAQADSTAQLCPDGKHLCPSDMTCCKLQSEGWGCCLYPKAVCCDDEIHCCPEGYTCDNGCVAENSNHPFSFLSIATRVPTGNSDP